MTALEVVTLVTAIVGAVTGTGALVWGVSQYLLTGPRVKVNIKEARLGMGGYVSGPGSWRTDDPQFFEPMLAVEVVNHGRAPTTVEAVAIRFANKIEYRDLDSYGGANKSTPHRLEEHSSATWLIDLRAAQATVDVSTRVLKQPDRRVWGRASLSTGKTVLSTSTINVP